ncbi:hypothetical protein JCM11491_006269 [Sporobolomyces phaffii]
MFIVKLFTVAFLLVSSALALIVPENSNLVRMPTYGGSRGGGGFGRDLGSFLSKRGSVGKAAILGTHDEPKSVDGEGGGEGGVGAPKLSSTA